MKKPATSARKAIFDLLDDNPDLKPADMLPLLKKAGVKLGAEDEAQYCASMKHQWKKARGQSTKTDVMKAAERLIELAGGLKAARAALDKLDGLFVD